MKSAEISDEAVQKATGKTSDEWYKLLDGDGAARMKHKDIAQTLYDKYGVPGWWCQMVTVGYERARGLRVVHQKCDGEVEASKSLTLNVPLGQVYPHFADAKLRAKWLKEKVVVRTATENKSMRLTWPDGSIVCVYFWPKADKVQVTIQHTKLSGVEDVEKSEAFWTDALPKMKAQAVK